MNTDVEELLRDGMERFTADVRAPAGLASETGRRHRRRRVARTAVACGTAAVTAAAVALVVVTGGAHRTPASTGLGRAQARTVAYVTRQVENALINENMVYAGHTGGGFPNVTFAYRNQSVWDQIWPATDYRDRIVNGKHLWDFPPQFRGKISTAQGTALVGGKLVSVLVTYYNHDYAIYGSAVLPKLSPCSVTAALAASGPPTVAVHWTAFINSTLRCGAASVTGHVKIGGVETTEITGKPVTVKLQPGYAKTVNEKWATARWTLYVNPTTYLPVRIYGSLQTFGGSAGSYNSSSVTNVRWLEPTPANIAKTLVTIPPGFHRMGSNYTG
jgi:hypothetical protein